MLNFHISNILTAAFAFILWDTGSALNRPGYNCEKQTLFSIPAPQWAVGGVGETIEFGLSVTGTCAG